KQWKCNREKRSFRHHAKGPRREETVPGSPLCSAALATAIALSGRRCFLASLTADGERLRCAARLCLLSWLFSARGFLHSRPSKESCRVYFWGKQFLGSFERASLKFTHSAWMELRPSCRRQLQLSPTELRR